MRLTELAKLGAGGLVEIDGADMASDELPEELKTGDWMAVIWLKGADGGEVMRVIDGELDYTPAEKTRAWIVPWPG